MYINDRFKLKDSTKSRNNGFLVFRDVKIANSRNIQTYQPWEFPELPDNLQDKDEIRIYRSEKEVKKSADSFAFLPVTDEHPWEDVTTKNFIDYGVGMSSETIYRKKHLTTSSIVITDADMIIKLQSKDESYELSCGYTAEIVFEAGTTESGELYDGYMKKMQGNHIAIVERGKCGGSCKLY